MKNMLKCENCKVEYPNHLVSSFRTNKKVLNVCGICALELGNIIHGINRLKFDGLMAESLRLQAIEFREKIQKEKEIENVKP